jgi:hypothetical protein
LEVFIKAKRQRVSLFVDEDVWAAYAELAPEERVSQAQLARRAMRDQLAKTAA